MNRSTFFALMESGFEIRDSSTLMEGPASRQARREVKALGGKARGRAYMKGQRRFGAGAVDVVKGAAGKVGYKARGVINRAAGTRVGQSVSEFAKNAGETYGKVRAEAGRQGEAFVKGAREFGKTRTGKNVGMTMAGLASGYGIRKFLARRAAAKAGPAGMMGRVKAGLGQLASIIRRHPGKAGLAAAGAGGLMFLRRKDNKKGKK